MPYNQILQITQPQLGSPTSIALIPGGRNRLVAGFTGGAIVLFDTANGNILRNDNREDQESTINSVAWSPNRAQIATGSTDGNVQIWNAETLQLIRTIGADNMSISSVAWSPDSSRVVSGSADGHAVIWNVADGQQILTLGEETEDHISEEPEEGVLAVAWRPNGLDIESSAANGMTYSWGVEEPFAGELLSSGHDVADTMSIAYNTDGSRIVKGERNGRLFSQNPETGLETVQMVGHTASVNSVCWSRDNSIIVSGSSDKTVRLWNASNGANLEVLQGHTDAVTGVAVSPDNNYIFSSSRDRTIKVWENSRLTAAKIVNKMLKNRVISSALDQGLIRQPGYFGPTDPGGQEYQKAAKRWVNQGGLEGGKRKKTNKRKRTNKKSVKTNKKKRTTKKTNKINKKSRKYIIMPKRKTKKNKN
jgi:WD40 repeat protein